MFVKNKCQIKDSENVKIHTETLITSYDEQKLKITKEKTEGNKSTDKNKCVKSH